MLFDNARALVEWHDAATREVVFNAFAKHWGFRPRACAPYRARTKGKDERGVGYVKNNAIAGRQFASWAAFEAHLDAWTREVAEVRVHGTTDEAPIVRFARDEAKALQPLAGRPPLQQMRELIPAGPGRLLCRGRPQRLQRAVALDPREGAGRDHRRQAAGAPWRPRGRGP